jgi:hypothetical protein
MIESLGLIGIGSAALGAIGAHLHYRRKVTRLERQNRYLLERNVNLRELNDAANKKEREARTAQYLAERDAILLESREKEWAKRLLADMHAADTTP